MGKIVIALDESYTRTGLTIMKDKQIIIMRSIDYKGCKDNTAKRAFLKENLKYYIKYALNQKESNDEVFVLIERARTFSGGHMSTKYLLSVGSLIATIVDVTKSYNLKTYSVDTKAWKRQIVGTVEGKKNKYDINPNKYPTILYLKSKNLLDKIVVPYDGKGKKGVIPVKINNQIQQCKINDDLADSYCIAEYGFLPVSKQKLKEENI